MSKSNVPLRSYLSILALVSLASGCDPRAASDGPSLHFTKIPPAHIGGEESLEPIEGQAARAKPGERVVLYAKSEGKWWVQPFANRPFTPIAIDSTWRTNIHLGEEYAALLVDASYVAPPALAQLPSAAGPVLAVTKSKGTPYVPRMITFSGYEWEARQLSSVRGGKITSYNPANAWTDASGFLHLRMIRQGERWSCADVGLTTSLGQGSYTFSVRDVSQLDPAAVVTMYTWDPTGRFHREVDVEISRWGRPAHKNAQYVVQPYWEPSNVSRFELPAGPAIFSFNWKPGTVSFRTSRQNSRLISEHVFTSGVPSPGGETVHINLYAFGNSPVPMKQGAEVVIEKFSFLP